MRTAGEYLERLFRQAIHLVLLPLYKEGIGLLPYISRAPYIVGEPISPIVFTI